MSRFRKTPLYGNCLIVAPDGQALCRTNQKKVDWYLERNLGEIISDDPVTLKLFFEPSGRVGAEHPYNTSFKENRCVCCGETKKITRHHVVPICFRKHFPEKLKRHRLHDVLPLCVTCHDKYEAHATDLKKKYSEEFDVPLAGVGVQLEKAYYKVRAAGAALVNHYDKLPEERKLQLIKTLKDFYQRDVCQEDIVAASKLNPYICGSDYKTFGQCVVEKLENINDFEIRWRSHFVDYMKPKYLPEHWEVNSNA